MRVLGKTKEGAVAVEGPFQLTVTSTFRLLVLALGSLGDDSHFNFRSGKLSAYGLIKSLVDEVRHAPQSLSSIPHADFLPSPAFYFDSGSLKS